MDADAQLCIERMSSTMRIVVYHISKKLWQIIPRANLKMGCPPTAEVPMGAEQILQDQIKFCSATSIAIKTGAIYLNVDALKIGL